MKPSRICFQITLAGLVLAGSGGSVEAAREGSLFFGRSQALGQGHVRTFAEVAKDGAPIRLGVMFSNGMLRDLPSRQNTNNFARCFDVSGDDVFGDDECVGDYERVLELPREIQSRSDIPFRWVGLNWNPKGHLPPAPHSWAAPHFDFHFYMVELGAVQQIRPGPCAEFIDCDDFVTATKPVQPQFLPKNHINVDAAVPAMGNHLVDSQAPELNPPFPEFTHTWIYGAYDGHITFYEPMVTREFLESEQDVCTPLNLPQAWEVSGYYPTTYCIHTHHFGRHTVVLEDFVLRQAP